MHLKRCLAELRKSDLKKAKLELETVLVALRVRSLIGPLLGEKSSWSVDYESLANDLSHYDAILSEFEKFDRRTRDEIMEDLSGDIKATLEGVKRTEIVKRKSKTG